MNQQLLSVLRREIEHSFGRKIVSSRDCLQLVDDIYNKTGYNINSNTLRRFFGLVKTDYSASPSTVTILSKYCGFDSLDQIGSIAEPEQDENAINKEEVIHFLVSLFRQVEIKGYNSLMESLVQQAIAFLERNPTLTDRFQREIARLKAGQYYYFERNVNMDRLNGYYGDGLQYYLRANPSEEGKLFAHSVLVFRYWLTENATQLEKHMESLQAISIRHNYAPHILGRYIAARLFYANAHNEPIEKILLEASRFHVAIMSNRSNSHPFYPDFELVLCEALILVANWDEARDYIRRGKTFFTGSKDAGIKTPFSFWESLINSKKDYPVVLPDANRRQPGTQPTFYPQNKRYYNLLSLLQQSRIKSSQVAELVAETGFSKILKLYTRKVENS